MREKSESKPSFIAEARREQIIQAAVDTLDEIGYVKASLSQIAKRAGISTALISYHFADKEDLMNQLLIRLIEDTTAYVLERVNREQGHREKLHAFIEASLAYQGTHPARYAALIEIVFNARTPDNVAYYRAAGDDEDDALLDALRAILRDGQADGVFGDFDVDVAASLIQGGIGEYMLSFGITRKIDLETYCAELIKLADRAVGIN